MRGALRTGAVLPLLVASLTLTDQDRAPSDPAIGGAPSAHAGAPPSSPLAQAPRRSGVIKPPTGIDPAIRAPMPRTTTRMPVLHPGARPSTPG